MFIETHVVISPYLYTVRTTFLIKKTTTEYTVFLLAFVLDNHVHNIFL